MIPDPGFWAGRRVLVTGHTGHDGAWACLWLQRLGAIVTGLSLPPRQALNVHEAVWPRDGREDIIADLRDPAAIKAALGLAQPAAILHLAGMTDPDEAEATPTAAFATNVLGTLHLLDAAAIEPHPDLLAVAPACPARSALAASLTARGLAVDAYRARWQGGLVVMAAPACGHPLDRIAAYLCAIEGMRLAPSHRIAVPVPRLDASTAASWTDSWYAAATNGADMRAFSLNDIARWESLA